MSVPSVAPLDASKLRIELTPSPKDLPDPSTLVFGQTFTDHMLTAKWNIQTGWADPVIQPYGPLALDPSSTVLHYAPTLFEGMKAYVDKQGRTRLFRPDLNMARLNRGAARLAFPTLDGETLTELIKELLRVDQRWVPTAEGCSLYIRPTMIGTRASLGVGPSTEVLLFVMCVDSRLVLSHKADDKTDATRCTHAASRPWQSTTPRAPSPSRSSVRPRTCAHGPRARAATSLA